MTALEFAFKLVDATAGIPDPDAGLELFDSTTTRAVSDGDVVSTIECETKGDDTNPVGEKFLITIVKLTR